MLKRLILSGYKFIRKRSLDIDPELSNSYLFIILFRSLIGLLRGYCYRFHMVSISRNVDILGKNKISISPGCTIGPYCYIDATGKQGITFGRSCTIGSHSLIKVSGSYASLGKGIIFGDHVGLGDFSHIGGAGGVTIGSHTIIGAYFSVHPENHNYDDIHTPIRLQGVTRQGIRIGAGCWIGAKVTILDGAVIGNNCVVAAGSVVRGHFPDACVIGGVPAKILKKIGSCNSDAN